MASGYQAPVSANQVGSYFATQYYKVLQQQPDYAHQFYTDSSTAIRVDGETSETSTALMEIHELITSLNFTNIEIKTINSLESWNGGVLVVVSGSVKGKDFSGRRKFVQTFLLAPQDKGYFVLNDVFHFIDAEPVYQQAVPVLSEYNMEPQLSSSAPLAQPPVSGYSYEAEASEYVNSVHIDGGGQVDEYGLDEQEQEQEYEQELEEEQQQHVSEIDNAWEEIPAEQPSVLHQNVVEAVPDPVYAVEEPVAEPQKFTYASILRTASKGQPVPVAAPRPPVTKSVLPPPSDWQPPQPAVQQSYTQEPSLEASVENPSFEEEGELKSVYVRNLPSTVSAADLEQEFKNFGTITHDGVFIRNRKDIGVCYAFVEFEDLVGVQNAIKASPIQLAGRQVYIEGRRANSGIASRGGRGRGRGRGSYPSEAPRGRFGGRSSGRGGYQDAARGNGFRA